MSKQSQEKNMRKLGELLSRDLGYIGGERECGPNGDKKAFLKIGKTFLWNLSKDLKLSDAKISVNPGGIAVSGECTLTGMWDGISIYIQLSHRKRLCNTVGFQQLPELERSILYSLIAVKNNFGWIPPQGKRLLKCADGQGSVNIFRYSIANNLARVQINDDAEIQKIHTDFGICNITDPHLIGRSGEEVPFELIGIVLILTIISGIKTGPGTS